MTLFPFTGIVIQEDGGYSSLCPELDVASAGNTPEEARAMLLEALALHLEGAIEDGLPCLRPIPADVDPRNTTTEKVVQIPGRHHPTMPLITHF